MSRSLAITSSFACNIPSVRNWKLSRSVDFNSSFDMAQATVPASEFDLILNNFVRLLRSNVSLALEIDQECLTILRNEFNVDFSGSVPIGNIMEGSEVPIGNIMEGSEVPIGNIMEGGEVPTGNVMESEAQSASNFDFPVRYVFFATSEALLSSSDFDIDIK
jgi:hypothetical protein